MRPDWRARLRKSSSWPRPSSRTRSASGCSARDVNGLAMSATSRELCWMLEPRNARAAAIDDPLPVERERQNCHASMNLRRERASSRDAALHAGSDEGKRLSPRR
eukprot:1879410-Pleurochrysis_carterae.AAC.6